jgi:hypothetical protein
MSLKSFAKGLPIIGGLFDDSEEKAMDMLRQNRELYEKLTLPELQDYNPEEYKMLGDYSPDQANSNTVSEDPMVRSAQLSALQKMAGLADTGLSDVDNAAFQRARQEAAQISNSGLQASLQNATARGVGGSGLEFAMREMAGQNGANQALNSGLSQAETAAKQRALYAQAYGSALSGLRSQDYTANRGNADILNQFNLVNTNAKNQAQLRNLDTRQQLSNENVGQRNFAQQYDNQMKQQGFQNQMAKTSGMAGQNTSMAQGYAAQNAASQSDRNANAGLGLGVWKALTPQKAPVYNVYGTKKEEDEE